MFWKIGTYASIVLVTSVSLNANAAWACPSGQYRDGWFGVCLPKIGGDVGNAAERLKNEIRGQVGGSALAIWLRQSRDTAVSTSKPVPDDVREALSGYISKSVIDKAKFKIGDNGFFNAANNIFFLNDDVSAVTLIDVIVSKDEASAEDISLWAHELAHVRQFMEWGERDFSMRYSRNWRDVEDEAYRVQRDYSEWVEDGRPPLGKQASNPRTFGSAVSSFEGTLNMANLDGAGHFIIGVTDVTGDGRADLVSTHTNGSAYVWPGKS